MKAFAPEGYWTKAQLFANRATEPGDCRSEDERRLWAALALEVLAKWALARLSPTLVADPVNGDGKQLLKALGLDEGGPYVAITAKTAYARCARVFRPFDAKSAEKYSHARNEYLHGTEIALLRIPNDPWWSGYWSLINVLLAADQMNFSNLIGGQRAPDAERYLALNAKRLAQRLEALVRSSLQNLERYASGQMSAPDARRWETWDGRAGFKYSDVAECPACKDEGLVEGEEALDGELVLPTSEYEEPYRERTWFADHFTCSNCHLVLDRMELLEEAGIPTEHEFQDYEDVYDEPEYGND